MSFDALRVGVLRRSRCVLIFLQTEGLDAFRFFLNTTGEVRIFEGAGEPA